jgi:hypothetical protein
MNYYKTNMKRRTRGGSRHKYMLIPKVSTWWRQKGWWNGGGRSR